MSGKRGLIIWIFKQYSLNYIELLCRQYNLWHCKLRYTMKNMYKVLLMTLKIKSKWWSNLGNTKELYHGVKLTATTENQEKQQEKEKIPYTTKDKRLRAVLCTRQVNIVWYFLSKGSSKRKIVVTWIKKKKIFHIFWQNVV